MLRFVIVVFPGLFSYLFLPIIPGEDSLFQWNVLVISWKLLSLQGTVPRKLPSYYLKITSLSRGKLPIFAEGLLLSPGDFPSCLKVTNFLSPYISWRGLLKWVPPSVCRHNEKGSLWMQLLLQFLTDLFETLQVFLSPSEDGHQVLGLSSCYFLSTFSTFMT